MPRKLNEKDFYSWGFLADRWGLSDGALWDLFDKSGIALYKMVKNRFQQAPDTVTLGGVGNLWIRRDDAAKIERHFWKKVQRSLQRHGRVIQVYSESPGVAPAGISKAPNPKLVSRIKLPSTFDRLLPLPELDPGSIVLSRSQPLEVIDQAKTRKSERSEERQPLPTTLDKETFRKEAKQRWLSGSQRNTSQMANELIKRFAGTIRRKKMYSHKVVCDWIRDLNPDPKPGNPCKAKKE